MSSQLQLLFGAAVLLFVMVDVAWTTLTTQGSGPITRLITGGFRFASAQVHAISGSRAVLAMAGPSGIVAIGGVWLLGLWGGWLLVFCAFPGGIVNAQSGAPADFAERVYFVGFTLSTLGVGDFKPQSEVTRVLTALAAFNGLVLVTLVITYAVPLVQGAVTRRKLAFSISLLGSCPQEMVLRAWESRKSGGFESALEQVSADLIQCSEQRLAYPLLDLFYCRHQRFSLGVQLGRLDEALSLLTQGLQPNCQWHSFTVENSREVVSQYLYRVERKHAAANLEAPPIPAVGLLKAKGLPVVDNQEEVFCRLEDRRLRLHNLVRAEGWDWSDVEHDPLTGVGG
ncbi:MAG: potassium channel family protein [Marinobacter sp.]|uniref:potassium channel family protein n=1 Tax=Marinobacter sp. TaxID=50741 RepID=UPI003298BB95